MYWKRQRSLTKNWICIVRPVERSRRQGQTINKDRSECMVLCVYASSEEVEGEKQPSPYSNRSVAVARTKRLSLINAEWPQKTATPTVRRKTTFASVLVNFALRYIQCAPKVHDRSIFLKKISSTYSLPELILMYIHSRASTLKQSITAFPTTRS